MDNLVNLQVMPLDSKVSIEIDGNLFVRIQQVLLDGLPYKDLTHFMECIKLVKAGNAPEGIPYHLQTLLHLIQMIESAAKTQKLVQIKQFNPETREVVD